MAVEVEVNKSKVVNGLLVLFTIQNTIWRVSQNACFALTNIRYPLKSYVILWIMWISPCKTTKPL